MDPTDMTLLLDALTGGTSAKRFGEFLATASPDLPIAPTFDMPLLAAHQSFAMEPLSAPHTLLPGGAIDLLPTPPPHYDYMLPVSTVTDASATSYRSEPPSGGIRKKRARASTSSSPTKAKPEHVLSVASAAAAAALQTARSVASDVSSLSPQSVPISSQSASFPCNSSENDAKVEVKKELVSVPPLGLTEDVVIPQLPSSSLPKSHTRKCREKVTKQFENLLEVLPRPPKGVEIKHKAQILEYTIKIFRYLLLRRTSLQTEVALASKDALRQWMNVTISSAIAANDAKAAANPVPISVVLEPFVGLYCVKKSWTYGEMWLVDPDTKEASLASCVFNTDDDDVLRRFDSFATISRSKYSGQKKLETGIVSRVISSHRPEWLNDLPLDPTVFDRATLAKQHGLRVAEAVPVMLDAERCTGVLLFADVESHTFSTADMTTLFEYTSVLGSLFVQYVNSFPSQTLSRRADEVENNMNKVQCASHDPEREMEDFGELQPMKDGSQESFEDSAGSELIIASHDSSFFGESEFVISH